MGGERKSYFTRLAPIIVLAALTGCHKQVTSTPPSARQSYGAKVRYAEGQKIEYPDFTIEFVGEKPPRSYERYPRREFRITGGGQVQEVSWGRDYGDIGLVKFKSGDDKYLIELVGSLEYGFLGEDVMVVWKNPPADTRRSIANHDSLEALIEALVKAPFKTVYHDDGAADATVTAVATPDASRQDAPAQVRAVLDLGPSCLPLLIARLDDQRLTSATFDGGRFVQAPIQVHLGYVCLDILLNATAGQAVHVADCSDDGLGACVRAGYYFRPDVLSRPDGVVIMQQVKTRWQRAYRAKRVRFEYPTWLKRG